MINQFKVYQVVIIRSLLKSHNQKIVLKKYAYKK